MLFSVCKVVQQKFSYVYRQDMFVCISVTVFDFVLSHFVFPEVCKLYTLARVYGCLQMVTSSGL